MKKYKSLLILLITFIAGVWLGFTLIPVRNSPAKQDAGPVVTNVTKSEKEFSCDDNLISKNLSKGVLDNKNVTNFLLKNCLIEIKSYSKELTGDSNKELIIITSGYGCASCHAQTLYIFNTAGKVIFEISGSDLDFSDSASGFEVLVHLSVYPSDSLRYFYTYNKDLEKFELQDVKFAKLVK